MTNVRVHKHLRRRFVAAPARHLTEYKPKSQFQIQMEPEDFLRAVGYFEMNEEIREAVISEQVVQQLMTRIETEEEIDPLFLDVDTINRKVVGHEGRHRAVAAMRLGLGTIPVIVYLYSRREGYMDATPARIAKAKRIILLGELR